MFGAPLQMLRPLDTFMDLSLKTISIAYAVMMAVLFQVHTSGVDFWWSPFAKIVLLLISCLPAVAAFFPGWAGKRPMVATAAGGMLAGYCFSSAVIFVLIGFGPGQGGVGFMRVLLVLIPLEALLVVFWFIVWVRSIGGKSGKIVGSVLLAPVVALLAAQFFVDLLGQEPPWYVGGNNTQNIVPENDLVKIDACAWRYRSSNGRFPARLSELAHWDSYCLEDLASGSHGHYAYRYEGANDHFRVRAQRARNIWVVDRPWNGYESGESGLVWEWNKPQSLVPISIGPHQYKSYLECLRNTQAVARGTLRSIVTQRKCEVLDQFVSDNEIKTYKARIVLKAMTAQGDFILESRPLLYGDVTIRSYVADRSGQIHATAEDRPATMADPLADEREFWSAIPGTKLK